MQNNPGNCRAEKLILILNDAWINDTAETTEVEATYNGKLLINPDWRENHRWFTFTYMHLADTFIQSDLQCIQAIHYFSLCVFPGNRTHNLLRCLLNALPLSHRNTWWRTRLFQLYSCIYMVHLKWLLWLGTVLLFKSIICVNSIVYCKARQQFFWKTMD